MKVEIAGYNVDARVLQEMEKAGIRKEQLTPEVISAAYARISRDPRPVSELRRVALEEVEKARKSNRSIIFEMGHHSVAEHAVFNFDIVGISRLAIESLERFRLCSYTEKSQRYITLDSDFVIPSEMQGTPFESELMSLVVDQTSCYEKIKDALLERLAKDYPDIYQKKSGRRLIDGLAKEDARYVTILATTGQLGFTANARNLELIIRRFTASKLAEVRDLGRILYEKASAVAPSLLLFTESSKYDAQTVDELGALQSDVMPTGSPRSENIQAVRLVNYTSDADRIVAAALLYLVSAASFEDCRMSAKEMSREQLAVVFDKAMQHMDFYDAPLREFEHVALTFDIALSASAFAQLKRHRMTTQSLQVYDPNLGVTVPPSIIKVGLEEEFRTHIGRTEQLYERLSAEMPHAASYVLTNAHRRRVLMTMNLRELYHFIRLREDTHAQWDIRALALEMRNQAVEVMPLSTLLLCGKSDYRELFEKVFGRQPDVLPPVAPFSAQIKY
jgi:flavin-dependent thymidylate synthase